MRVGIDASNIRAGGGLTHLAEVLAALDPSGHGIERVTVWGGRKTLDRLPNRPWLVCAHETALDGSALHRAIWRWCRLDKQLRIHCDVLFAPGGVYRGGFRPFVTMSQNLLPFDHAERARFGLTLTRLRYHLLEHLQSATFRRADGVIFLTEIAKRKTLAAVGDIGAQSKTVPHGIAPGFLREPRPPRKLEDCTGGKPLRILYVSIVNLYKHPWHVADAVCRLRRAGLPVQLDLVGRAYPPALRKLRQVLDRIDPKGECVRYLGPIPYDQLASTYADADVFVFASSCETFGMIVLEAMASGLPVACSERSAMSEALGDTGAYFNPESPADIAATLRTLAENSEQRGSLAQQAYERAQTFTWDNCADETFSFIVNCASKNQ